MCGPVSVMDREADVYAVCAEQKRLGTVDLLVRAKHNRWLGKQVAKLFELVRAEPVQAQLAIRVARWRRGGRAGGSRGGRRARSGWRRRC